MALAAVTLFIASAIHAGLIGSFDLFPGAAIPEAIIGSVLAVATILSFVSRSTWVITIGATTFAIAGTLFGLGFTIPRGEAGDIAYHLALLATLFIAAALLVRSRPERA